MDMHRCAQLTMSTPRIINVSSSLAKSHHIITAASLPRSILTRLTTYTHTYPVWREILNQQYDAYIMQHTKVQIKTEVRSRREC